MKKALSILLAATMFFSLMTGCDSDVETTPVSLDKVGDFSSQPADAPETLTLPQGMMGNGMKVGDLQNVNLMGDRADLQWSGEPLDLYVTLYNANESENTFALYMIVDQNQISFCVDGAAESQKVYMAVMPPQSYTVIPVRITSDQIPSELSMHDLWILSDGIVPAVGSEPDKSKKRTMAYRLNLISGEKYWAASEQEELIPEDVPIQESPMVFTSRTRIREANKNVLPLRRDATNITLQFSGEYSGLAQTFLLLDYQTLPLTESSDSMIWFELENQNFTHSYLLDNSAASVGSEIFLLTLPVGRDGMPDTSERYVLSEP